MALIEANRLAVTIPNGPDDPPSSETATERISRWLVRQYGYPPPLERLEGKGWSDRWEVGGRPAPGWRYEAIIPRHLGPARTAADNRAHHPAGRGPVRRGQG